MNIGNSGGYLPFLIFILHLHISQANSIPRVLERPLNQPLESDQTISEGLFGSLEELARLVDITYCVGGTGVHKPFRCLSRCKEFENFELITTWNTGPLLSDSCGYIALSHSPSDPRIIVAFRGTYSIENALLDLSAYPQSYVPYSKDGDGDGDGDSKPRCANCTVHSGFMTSWENTRSVLLDHVSEARKRYPDYKLVLTGHSLGGAVAALAGLEMLLRGWGPQVTTFGEPRVGNDDFVRFLNEMFNLTDAGSGSDEQGMMFRRVTHVDDPVPLLPLDEWGYKMHAGEIFISKSDLPQSASDVRICQGGEDPMCIAGSDEQGAMYKKHELIWSDIVRSKWDHPPAQAVLSSENTDDEPLVGTRWNLIPARYRLWQLLFAHRDYFWRLGLCVPSGRPERDVSVVDADAPM